MRSAPWGARVVGVTTTPNPIVLRIELDHWSEPITGVLLGPAGERLAFAGWLGLASVLRRAATADPQDSPEVSQP